MNQKDIKLLWGRAGNRCAICRVELSQDSKAVTAAFTLGEQAHIVGEKDDAPRGHSPLSLEERNSYHNLILLCPTHHTEIDKNELDWPVEKLHFVKSTQELWVRETLGDAADSRLLAKQIAVTSVIDSAVDLCGLETWKEWTSWALAPDPCWSADMPDRFWDFLQRVRSAIWPEEFEELRRAATTLAILLHNAASKYLEHADISDAGYVPHKFYKAEGRFNPNYHEDLQEYENWLQDCWRLVKEATAAANWFADVVRRDINPMFFAERGKFVVVEGPFEDLTYRASIPEFPVDAKSSFPASLNTGIR